MSDGAERNAEIERAFRKQARVCGEMGSPRAVWRKAMGGQRARIPADPTIFA